ncbi:hypothetical protein [Escherichia coli]|nr:hypothetical protein [Escherichia coli]
MNDSILVTSEILAPLQNFPQYALFLEHTGTHAILLFMPFPETNYTR